VLLNSPNRFGTVYASSRNEIKKLYPNISKDNMNEKQRKKKKGGLVVISVNAFPLM
jgi:hypothetical protein